MFGRGRSRSRSKPSKVEQYLLLTLSTLTTYRSQYATDKLAMRISCLTFFLLCSVFTWARPGERCLSDQDCPSLGGRGGVPASSHPTSLPINYPSPSSPLPSHTDQEAVTKPAEEASYKPPPAEISQELSLCYNGKPNQLGLLPPAASEYD